MSPNCPIVMHAASNPVTWYISVLGDCAVNDAVKMLMIKVAIASQSIEIDQSLGQRATVNCHVVCRLTIKLSRRTRKRTVGYAKTSCPIPATNPETLPALG
jgi:hypothetical protein